MAKICSLNIYVGCFTMLTLLRFEYFLMLCRTRGMNIGNFLSRNRIRIGYYSIDIEYYTSCRSFSCLYWHTVASYYPLAKTRLVWDVKVNFISNKSLNNRAFPFSSALNSYLIREKNNSKLPVAKSSKESVRCPLSHDSSLAFINLTYNSLAKSRVIWRVKMNFISK